MSNVSRPVRIGTLVVLGYCSLLQLLPQANLLNYYYAFAVALCLPLTVAIVIARDTAPEDSTLQLPRAAAITLWLALLPLIPVGVSALFVANCAPSLGFMHYLLGPVVGSIVALGVGLSARQLMPKGPTKVVLIFWISLIFANIYWFYTRPPIYAFNIFIGYLNGAIYDPVVRVSAAWSEFRAVSVMVGLGYIFSSRLSSKYPRQGKTAIMLLTLASIGLTSRYQLTASRIENKLGGRLETDHFILIFDRQAHPLDAIDDIALDHEYRFEQLVSEMGVTPTEKITSFIYSSATQKQELMGAGRTYIAKPWSKTIHLNRIGVGALVLKHELVHVFGADIHTGWLGIPTRAGVFPRMALVEGFAVSHEGARGRLSIHQWSAAMREIGIAPPITDLLSERGFLSAGSSKAYTLTGSFILFLRTTYGQEAVNRLYATGDFLTTFNTSLTALVHQWQSFLRDRHAVPLSDADLAQAQFRFDAPSRFFRVCALEIGQWEQQARTALNRKEFNTAIELMERIYAFDPSLDKRLQLMNALLRAHQLVAALDHAQALAMNETAGSVIRTRALQAIADIDWLKGRTTDAHTAYLQLLNMPLSLSARRRIAVSAYATENRQGSYLGDRLRSYLFDTHQTPQSATDSAQSLANDFPQDSVVQYLLARRYVQSDDELRGIQAHLRALELKLPSPLLIRETHLQLAHAYRRQGEYDEAAAQYIQAKALFSSRGYLDSINDWIARCGWLKRRMPSL